MAMTAAATHVLLEAALAYAAMGWAVFPLHTPTEDGKCSCRKQECIEKRGQGKHPRTMNGLKDATTDPKQIEKWWGMWPLANIGIATGGSLMVLDVDPRHDGSTAGMDLPDTKRACTPGGGEHWYLRISVPVQSSTSRVGPGLDVRADGGYVVAPPSIGLDDSRTQIRGYSWDVGSSDDIVDAPAWLVARANARKLKEPQTGNVPEAFIAGARNTALSSLAGVMVRAAFGRDAIEAALLSENVRRCRPPLDDKEVQNIVASISRYQPTDPVQGKVATVLGGVELAKELPPIPWVCERLELAPGAPNVWAGYGYSGKTLAAQDLVICIAAGRMAWGHLPCCTGTVVHLDYEQGQRLSSERYQRLCRAYDVDLEALGESIRYVPFPPVYLDKSEGLLWLEDICRGAKFCVIDSLRAAFPTADENSSDIRKYLDPLARISEVTGCTIVIIHHARKRGEKDHGAAQSVRGSSAIFDACQSVLVFDGKKGEPSTVSLEKARITGSAHDDIELVFEDVEGSHPKWGLKVRGQGVKPRDGLEELREALIASVASHPGQSKRTIAEYTKGKAALKYELLRELIEDGKILEGKRPGKGGGAVLTLPLPAHPGDPTTEEDYDN